MHYAGEPGSLKVCAEHPGARARSLGVMKTRNHEQPQSLPESRDTGSDLPLIDTVTLASQSPSATLAWFVQRHLCVCVWMLMRF